MGDGSQARGPSSAAVQAVSRDVDWAWSSKGVALDMWNALVADPGFTR